MAGTQINNTGAASKNNVQSLIYVKDSWTDEWKPANYLRPISANEEMLPSTGKAVLRFDYGDMKQTDKTTYKKYKPKDFANKFVKIYIITDGSQITIWTGVIQGDTRSVQLGTSHQSGDQDLIAWGIAHLLDLEPIIDAKIYDSVNGVQTINHFPVFNERNFSGDVGTGNRTETIPNGEKAHCFGGTSQWTNLDILNYLLANHQPQGVTFTLDGQPDILDAIVSTHRLGGQTALEWIGHLVDKRRGIIAYVESDGEGDPSLYIDSLSGEEITNTTYGLVIAANGRQETIKLDSTKKDVTVKYTKQQSVQFDKIVVTGSRLKVCATFDRDQGTLVDNWTATEEAAYKAIVAGEASDLDRQRKADELKRVFQSFRIPDNWDGQVFDVDIPAFYYKDALYSFVDPTHQVIRNASPTLTDDAVLNLDVVSPFFRFIKRFLRDLPLKETDIVAAIKTAADADQGEPEFVKMLAFVKEMTWNENAWDQSGPLAPTYLWNGKWIALHEKFKNWQGENYNGATISSLDNDMGVFVKASVNHALALESQVDETARYAVATTNTSIVVDSSRVCLTAFYETDQEIRVVKYRSGAKNLSNPRTLKIDVDGAEMWYIVPRTVVGLDSNRNLLEHIGGLVRDDSPALRNLAALALSWYSKERQQVHLTYNDLGPYHNLGAFIKDIAQERHTQQVGTVVTSKAWDFPRQTTDIKTEFLNITPSAFFDFPGFSKPRAVAKELRRMRNEQQVIKSELRNLPARRAPLGDDGSNLSLTGILPTGWTVT